MDVCVFCWRAHAWAFGLGIVGWGYGVALVEGVDCVVHGAC